MNRTAAKPAPVKAHKKKKKISLEPTVIVPESPELNTAISTIDDIPDSQSTGEMFQNAMGKTEKLEKPLTEPDFSHCWGFKAWTSPKFSEADKAFLKDFPEKEQEPTTGESFLKTMAREANTFKANEDLTKEWTPPKYTTGDKIFLQNYLEPGDVKTIEANNPLMVKRLKLL